LDVAAIYAKQVMCYLHQHVTCSLLFFSKEFVVHPKKQKKKRSTGPDMWATPCPRAPGPFFPYFFLFFFQFDHSQLNLFIFLYFLDF
jgi:hypothetical protein